MAKTKVTKREPLSSALKKRLKAATKDWKGAKERAEEGSLASEFDDGKYLAKCIGAEFQESGSGRLQVDFKWKIIEGPSDDAVGKIKHDYQGCENEQNLEYLGRRIVAFGYDLPESLEDIEDILAEIVKEKPLCKIRLRTKGDFQNVYMDKVVEDEEDEDTEDDEDTDDADAADDSDSEDEESEDEAEDEEEEPEPEPVKKKKKAAPSPEPEPPAKKKKKAAPEPEPEEDEDEEDEEETDEEDEDEESVELSVGMAVIAETTKGAKKGVVKRIIEDENKVAVEFADGKTLRIAVDKITADDSVPEEPPAKKKTAKK